MKSAAFITRFLFGVLLAFISVANVRAEGPAMFPVGEFTFTRPARWEWVEVTSEMRKAQLKVADTDGKASAEVVFFQFGPGAAGGVKANAERWLKQFTGPRDQINAKIEEVTVGKTKITYVQAEGTFKSGMPGGPQTPIPDYALEGAILESEGGSVFVKMTGPKTLVKASAADFRTMVESGPKKN